MKGIVFTEFFELVESNFGIDVVDEIIEKSDLASEGAYTSVGTYTYEELVQLVVQLSDQTGVPVPTLTQAFGRYLFRRFTHTFPQFFQDETDAFSFLSKIDNYIYTEVRKLYPDAQLPKFVYELPAEDQMVLHYTSNRPFADLAQGLISATIEHFGESIELVREDQGDKDGRQAQFHMTVRKEATCPA